MISFYCLFGQYLLYSQTLNYSKSNVLRVPGNEKRPFPLYPYFLTIVLLLDVIQRNNVFSIFKQRLRNPLILLISWVLIIKHRGNLSTHRLNEYHTNDLQIVQLIADLRSNGFVCFDLASYTYFLGISSF